ncbi:DUF2927 domain-containing protein [Aquimixticola soesokkakensis]|uniref:DUF2927 domain-containing protein n=1 Tax=Aquimixticola soesokkakensis TaxID=1519096 RepID=UPI001F2DBB62|nr:DUF2927 domain-containing protein [Aquimixticola soesokkakensis]
MKQRAASPRRVLAGAALCLLLTACAKLPLSPIPAPRPVSTTPPQPRPQAPSRPERSATSDALAAYYARAQINLLAQGLLRSDTGAQDAPFTSWQLARNFETIALNDEYTGIGGEMVARQTASVLSRWEVPVTLSVEFGDTVGDAMRNRDTETLRGFTARLARVTGHPIRMGSPEAANFHVFVVNEDERVALGPRLEQLIPGISQTAVRTVVNLPRSTYCVVLASDPQDDGAYQSAVAIIRAEHPDLMRLSCLHEEIAQGLGLANDSPAARPSIFNDDEEFATLTPMDEQLLRMLYDPRLTPGMTADEARASVNAIARELMGESS